MKTPSRTFTYAALAVVAIVAALSLRAFAMASCQQSNPGKKWKFCVIIGGPGPNDYLELKPDQPNQPTQEQIFRDKLIALKNKGGCCEIRFLGKRPTDQPIDDYCDRLYASIKTDKVTKSEIANSVAADASVANDPNAVQHLYSDYADDIYAVLQTFK
jgi:hypothetical protein